jgi:DNA-binding MarR family transcriptional regulator
MDQDAPLHRGNLAAALLGAADWCNDALLAGLEARGWPRFTRTQALVLARIGTDGARPSALARDIGVTRQSMQAVLAPLLAEDILRSTPDPDDGRATIVTLGARGRELSNDVQDLLGAAQRVLRERIGNDAVAALLDVLAAPWGSHPTPPQLDQVTGRTHDGDD